MGLDGLKDLMADLDTEEDFAEGWAPEPGDILTGEVETISYRASEYGEDYPIVTVTVAEGTTQDSKPVEESRLAFHAFRSVARSQVAQGAPVAGDLVAIRYDGEKHSKNGRDYHAYVVRVKHNKPEGMPF